MVDRQFNRKSWAELYATRHLKTDPGIREVYYLPEGAPEREIRMVEVNEMIAARDNDPIEPIDFGVDVGGTDPHKLLVLDITPAQWEKVKKHEMELPEGWSLADAISYPR